jgi:hypothetical protein
MADISAANHGANPLPNLNFLAISARIFDSFSPSLLD